MNKSICLLLVAVLVMLPVGVSRANFFPVPPSLTLVYIRADGTLEPPSLPIVRSGNIYNLTSDLANCTLEVQRNGIVIDGDGYTLDGGGIGQGVVLTGLTDVVVRNFTLTNFQESVEVSSCVNLTLSGVTIVGCQDGVELYSSSNNSIENCNVTENSVDGILLFGGSSHNSIADNQLVGNGNGGITLQGPDFATNSTATCNSNVIVRNYLAANVMYGIGFYDAPSNYIAYNNVSDSEIGIHLSGLSAQNDSVVANRVLQCSEYGLLVDGGLTGSNFTQNTIMNNVVGVEIDLSSNNLFYDNNLINNWKAAEDSIVSNNTSANPIATSFNTWSDSTSKQGNFWSDYAGYDNNSDGIGDVPRVIDANNSDLYPLMKPFGLVPDYMMPSPYPIPIQTPFVSPSVQTATSSSEPQSVSSVSEVTFALIGTAVIVAVALLIVVRRHKAPGAG